MSSRLYLPDLLSAERFGVAVLWHSGTASTRAGILHDLADNAMNALADRLDGCGLPTCQHCGTPFVGPMRLN